MTATRE